MKFTIRNVAELRSRLAVLLAAELGTFSNGLPAIWVEVPFVPQNLAVNGLQVIIQRHAKRVSGSVYRWEVTLRQFDRSAVGLERFDRAIAVMRRNFPKSGEVCPIVAENEYPRIQFSIYFHITSEPGCLAEA